MSALRIAVRAGVVVCVGAACLLGVGRLDNAVAVFDFQADANVAARFNERTYPTIVELPEAAKVFEDARLWMPDRATYRVVEGPLSTRLKRGSLRTFLAVLLMPRRETRFESAAWVFCYGCTRSTLGPRYETLSDSGQGFQFARRRS